MSNFYKNVLDNQIHVHLFGVGDVTIPANAGCVELAPGVASAINAMVAPNVVLEEVTPTFTVDDNPIVKSARSRAKAPKEDDAPVVEVTDVDVVSDVDLPEITIEDDTPKE